MGIGINSRIVCAYRCNCIGFPKEIREIPQRLTKLITKRHKVISVFLCVSFVSLCGKNLAQQPLCASLCPLRVLCGKIVAKQPAQQHFFFVSLRASFVILCGISTTKTLTSINGLSLCTRQNQVRSS